MSNDRRKGERRQQPEALAQVGARRDGYRHGQAVRRYKWPNRRQDTRRGGIERRRLAARPPSLIGEIVRSGQDRRKETQ